MRTWRTGLALLGALVLLSIVAVEPPDKKVAADASGTVETDSGDEGGGGPAEEGPTEDTAVDPNNPEATGVTTPDGKPVTGGPATTVKQGTATGRNYECKAGRNGGNTDRGVTGNRINLASTNVRSGTGSSFLGTSYIGMQAVVNRVNAAGGICGRLLSLRLVDDAWNPATGNGYLQTFSKGDYFALPVVPSSEGLTLAITNRTISSAGIPVVGTDGMLKEQYADPWVWPVATSTVSTMRIMAKYAHDNGAKSFGIVYDTRYKFGEEGAEAFKAYVNQLTAKDPAAYVGIEPGQGNYAGPAKKFNDECGANGCDFVAMLLTPETATTYISSQTDKDGRRQGFGRLMTGGAQPLFNERFGRDCGKPCDGMLVWTGYNPPIGRLSSEKDVAAYVDDVRSVDPGVDVNNQFLEGAYLGMKVFVDALQKVGPDLTRKRMQEVMNSMRYESSLSSPLQWSATQRFANQAAQPFRIVTASNSFAGFAEVGTGFLPDPTPGVVPKD
ncbi:MAG TPA: ABC transporter substrate-binding protein [Acidimicrobiales bacterium]